MDSAPPDRTLHILIVEDAPAHARLIEEVLKEIAPHAKVRVASDAGDAIAFLEPHPGAVRRPDLILLDLQLSDGDGLAVLKAVRQHIALKDTPVVVLTCSDARENVERAYGLRVNGYVRKPVNLDGLREAVGTIAYYGLRVATPRPRGLPPDSLGQPLSWT